MQLSSVLTVVFLTSTTVIALPPQWPPGYGPSPVWGEHEPGPSIGHQPWHRHIEVREAQPEALPEALPHAVPDAEFAPTLVQRSPPSEPNSHKAPPGGYGPGPAPGPIESVSHHPWKRALPEVMNVKRDATELVELVPRHEEGKEAHLDILEARAPTPASDHKAPGGYGPGRVPGPIESVHHQPWKRHVERDAMPEAMPAPASDVLIAREPAPEAALEAAPQVLAQRAAEVTVAEAVDLNKRDAMPEAQPDAQTDVGLAHVADKVERGALNAPIEAPGLQVLVAPI